MANDSKRARTVLMVLYHFPPVGGVAMSRNVRNVQHLPQYGWVPIVLTPRDVAGGLLDPGALSLVPDGVRVLRTRILEAGHLRNWAARVRDTGKGMGLIAHGKIYDYLGQNRQVLAMLPEGDARDLLEGLGWGVVADPDPASVAGAIERLVSLPPPNRPAVPMGIHDCAVLAGRLAGSLSAVAAVVHESDGTGR